MPTRFCQVRDSARAERFRPSRSCTEAGSLPAEPRSARRSSRASDRRRSTTRRLVSESDERAGVYVVCLQVWLLVSLCLAIVAAVTLAVGPIHSAVRVTSLLLWTLLGGALLMAAIRRWTLARPRRN
jgi:Flp pilus assembly protein TadB